MCLCLINPVIISRKKMPGEEIFNALEGFRNNFHTSIDLVHHPAPTSEPITEESLTRFAEQLRMSDADFDKMKTVAERILKETVPPLANSGNIEKVIIGECHLPGAGRFADSGFDIVLLFKEGEDLNASGEMVKIRLTDELKCTTGGPVGSGPTHPNIIHTVLDGVPVYIALGHRYVVDDEVANREKIWERIALLDEQNILKKVHLDQFAIDLYESSTYFMNQQAAPEETLSGWSVNTGSPDTNTITAHDKFVQDALRLARAWRQSSLSRKDSQFSSFDAWLIMLHAIHTEAGKRQPSAAGTIRGIKKFIKETLRGKGESPEVVHPGEPMSLKDVMVQFLYLVGNPSYVNIQFHDFYKADKVPAWITKQRPLILDPACPYRNTVYNLHKHVSEDLTRHAHESTKIMGTAGASLHDLFPTPQNVKRKEGA
jgi:ribonucleotide reductase beta subunit family protein with ferritin-like domain